MAEGCEIKNNNNNTLYDLSLSAVVYQFQIYKKYLDILPDCVLFDLYYQVQFFNL